MARVITSSTVRNDGTALKMCQMINTDIPILLISREEDLNFNDEIYSLCDKKFVVIDFIEEGWNTEIENTLVIGEGLFPIDFNVNDGWAKLNDFIELNPPKLYFKRELLEDDTDDWLLPIEYPSWQPDYQLHTKEEFYNHRPISVFNYWGRSHEARLILHGEIWKNAARRGYTVCDNIYQFNHFMHHEKDNPNKWVTFHIPFYDRQDMSQIMRINAMSKLSISMFGAGRKCFRNTGESIVNSICVMPEDGLAYSMPFIDKINSIKFDIKQDVTGLHREWDIVETCEAALQMPTLYDIYLESKKLFDWYRVDNYIKNYLKPKINSI